MAGQIVVTHETTPYVFDGEEYDTQKDAMQAARAVAKANPGVVQKVYPPCIDVVMTVEPPPPPPPPPDGNQDDTSNQPDEVIV
jgi:hypothetical protein